MGYVAARTVEATLLLVGLVAIAAVPRLDVSGAPELVSLLTRANGTAYQLAMAALAAGGVAFSLALRASGALPRWLAGLGATGYALLGLGVVLEHGGWRWGTALAGPGGLFEVLLGGWLLARGFTPASATSGGERPSPVVGAAG